MTFKTLSKEELKQDYSTRHGFVFQSPIKSSDKSIENLCNVLIQHNITKEQPDFITRLDDNTTAFVYKDDFDGPAFFQKADIATQVGVAVITPLYIFINN